MKKVLKNIFIKIRIYDVFRFLRLKLKRNKYLDKNILNSYDQLKLKKKKNNSVIIWSTHKSASTLINRTIGLLKKNSIYHHHDIETNISRMAQKYQFKIDKPINLLKEFPELFFKKFGYIYGPIRQPVKITNYQEYKNIFILRDPRDVLVSFYYWIIDGRKHSSLHKATAAYNKKRKEKFIKIGIDNYCIEYVDSWICPTYNFYKDIYDNSLYKKVYYYHDIILDKSKLVNDLKNILNLKNFNSEELNNLFDIVLIKKKSNNSLHIRSGKSSQFKKELSQKTIDLLNLKLYKVFKDWPGLDSTK